MGQSSNKLIYGVVLFVVAMLGVLIVANRPVGQTAGDRCAATGF